jgi:hypothetical protein
LIKQRQNRKIIDETLERIVKPRINEKRDKPINREKEQLGTNSSK